MRVVLFVYKAQAKCQTSHEMNWTEQIKFMISSMFDSTEFVWLNLDWPTRRRRIERVGQYKFELSSTFEPVVELYLFGWTQIAA